MAPGGPGAGSVRLLDPPSGVLAAVREGARAYRLIVAMWVRSTMAYPASFALTLLGNLVATSTDFGIILVMFSRVQRLGGFSLPEVALLYGSTGTSFGLVDLTVGSMDRLGKRIRDGTLDTLLLRPVPVLAQVAADRFAPRRIGRVTQGGVVLGWALARAPIDWTPARVLLVPLMVLSGAAIYAAVFVAGGAFQFRAGEAAEVQNSFTYGGNTLTQYPPSIFARDLVRGTIFLIPLAFVNWLPALRLLGRPLPEGLPGWVAWLAPLVAAVCCALAGLAWRGGLRAYRSTGS